MGDAMRPKTLPSILVTLLVFSALLFTGCEKASDLPVLGGSFNNSWTSDSGQVIRVMGYAEGHQAGSQAVFQVQFDNPRQNAPTWSDDYRVVLVDPATGNEWEIVQGEFDVRAWTAVQFPVAVPFPQGVDGQLWLHVLTASGGGLGVRIQVGERDADGRPTATKP